MKNCNIVRDLIPIYLDGETLPETSAFVKEHLTSCEECRAYCNECKKIPHALEGKVTRGNYHYSDIIRKVRIRKVAEVAAAAAAVAAFCGAVVKLSSRNEE